METVGVPEITPVEAFIVNPFGSVGEIVKTIPGVPPEEVTGVNGVATVETVKVCEGVTRVVVRATETVSAKVLELVAPFASVAVTV
jgi:hypothetical protein